MIASDEKLWLVRTKAGEILGPFTQAALFDAWHQQVFALEDEIAQSHGRWFSAQTLVGHDGDEFTSTSTRSQTVTKSMTSDIEVSAARERAATSREAKPLPPTPAGAPPRIATATKKRTSILAPILASVMLLILGGLGWQLISRVRTNTSVATGSGGASAESESPFLRQIASMIQSGETQSALNKLIAYHEHAPAGAGIDYLVPYAALLILSEENSDDAVGSRARSGATNRAKKLLEKVLYSKPSEMLESKAHLWLGYLELATGEGDLGEAQFLRAIRLNPRDAAARFNLARSYFKREKLTQALESLQLAEFEMPQLWLIHLLKGRVQSRLKKNESARASFQTALQTSQDRWSSYLYFATFLNNAIGEAEAAQQLLKRMLRRDPLYETYAPPPWGFFQEKVNYASYLEAFLNVMNRTSGEEKEVGRLYINYLMTNEDRDHRIEALSHKGGLLAKVLALKVLLDREPSADEIRNMLAKLPTDLDSFGFFAYAQRAEARIRIRQYAEAQQDLQQAILLSPQSAVIRWLSASLQKKTNHPDEAQKELQNLLAYHPTYIPAIVLLRSF